MLVVFSLILVANTKIISRHNFVVLLKLLQMLQEPMLEIAFHKFGGLRNVIIKRLQYKRFPMKFAKFFKNTFFTEQNTSGACF